MNLEMSSETLDVVIVGAGVHGLVVLRTYKNVHPQASIRVFDKGTCLGGVWAKDRLYPGLKTNNHFGTFEFGEHPMSTEGFSLADDHIPGEHVNGYLQSYVEEFDLSQYLQFNTVVDTAVDEGDAGWTVTVTKKDGENETSTTMKTARLIVATGLTSEPSMPDLAGRSSFGAPVYHTSEFAKAENGLGPYKKVVLLSGAKFSWDIACAYALAGIQVDWVIRESGHGPCWMTPNRLTPLKVIPELLLQTRLITWLSPCIWGDSDGFASIRNFLHQHWLGRKIVDGFFDKMAHSIMEHNKYDSHPETAKLKPWDDVFFIGTNRGLLNYGTDFFELVRKGLIRVHIADITNLSHHTVHLSDGQSLDAEVLICGTGWKDAPQFNFITNRELGLPGHVNKSALEHVSRADAEIFKKCPKLQNQPQPRRFKPITTDTKVTRSEPYRLYRFMVPPAFTQSRTLAFAGAYRSPATTIIAQAQALWITAFFDDQLPALRNSESADHIMYETVLHTQFGKWRYSRGFGARFPELWFECLPYVDLLLRDIGIVNRRKGSWWGERFTPYFPKDYAGIVREYKGLRNRREGAPESNRDF
ncbi:FAD/NAD(P)-binding domain-containing protein [Massarina eburnea CBS 473.64]|uniref:FAD/NAD(P)-binding domain-containing protein n=1 Tax=Massarina eburnea CBS 473.64 TaxID=1395130 RepID=A0A6A6SIB8_9PLEO|nr:FAD/NAD(P)-binding domain-containing protein [Massarina eburnea CBS 473.64]